MKKILKPCGRNDSGCWRSAVFFLFYLFFFGTTFEKRRPPVLPLPFNFFVS